MHRTFQLLLLTCFGISQGIHSAHAEFILDDFDDPAEAVAPEMLNDFVQTNNVGTLNAIRNIRIAASSLNSVATLDSDITEQGSLSADLLTPGTTGGGGSPLFAFQFNYDFAPTDISESGLNNAILFDFLSIEGTELPTFLRVIVRDDTNVSSFETHVINLPLTSGPFVAAMPFDSFTRRGGSPGLPDFTTIDEMDFDFFFLRPMLDSVWSTELRRVRIGRIPEPASGAMVFLGTSLLFFCRYCSGFSSQF